MSKPRMGLMMAALFIFLLCTGCGLKEGVIQKQSRSYLWFTGAAWNAVAYIDDLDPIVLKKTNRPVHYEISPGKHHIVVKRNGAEIVNRVLLVGTGAVREISVP